MPRSRVDVGPSYTKIDRPGAMSFSSCTDIAPSCSPMWRSPSKVCGRSSPVEPTCSSISSRCISLSRSRTRVSPLCPDLPRGRAEITSRSSIMEPRRRPMAGRCLLLTEACAVVDPHCASISRRRYKIRKIGVDVEPRCSDVPRHHAVSTAPESSRAPSTSRRCPAACAPPRPGSGSLRPPSARPETSGRWRGCRCP